MSEISSKSVVSTKAWIQEMSAKPKDKLTRREFFESIFDEIADMLDNKGYTYKDIAEGLKEKAKIEITPAALKVHITQIRRARNGNQNVPGENVNQKRKQGGTSASFVALEENL